MKKFVVVLLAVLLIGCFAGSAIADGEQNYLGIVWPSLQIEFFDWAANFMKSQAEEAGWKAEITSYDFDTVTQIQQMENFATMGVTHIISYAGEPEALVDVCKKLREQGIVMSFFATAPSDLDAYDNVAVANQYDIGKAMAENAVDWVNEKYPDAADGSIKAVMFALPTTEDDVQRDNGVRDTLKACPKIEIVKEYELDNDYNTTMPGMVDMMMLEHPDVQVVVCHFASLSIQADERLLTYSQIDRDNFGIFSGDIDTMIGERMMKTLDGEGLIRATGNPDSLVNEAAKVYPLAPFPKEGSGGSSDVGDVSWVVPLASFGAATFAPGSAGHSWQNVAVDGTTIGTKGLLNASRVFALTAVELLTDAKLLNAVKEEFKQTVGPDFKYVPLLGDRKPALDYRVSK